MQMIFILSSESSYAHAIAFKNFGCKNSFDPLLQEVKGYVIDKKRIFLRKTLKNQLYFLQICFK